MQQTPITSTYWLNWKTFLIFFLVATLMSSVYLYINVNQFANQSERTALQNAVKKAQEREDFFNRQILHYRYTIESIVAEPVFTRFISEPERFQSEAEALFRVFTLTNVSMMQLRYIDETGQEVIRFDRDIEDSLKIQQISGEFLQNKKNRYYSAKAKELSPNEIWFSRIDLNIENGVVEIPYKPTLRVVTPVYSNHQYKGFVIANYFIQSILKDLFNAPLYKMILADDDGEIIVHYDAQLSWSRSLNRGASLHQESVLQPDVAAILQKDEFTNARFYSKRLDTPIEGGLHLVMQLSDSFTQKMQQEDFEQNVFVIGLIYLVMMSFSLLVSRLAFAGRTLQSIRLTEQTNKAVFNQASFGVVYADFEGHILQANKRFCDLFNIKHNAIGTTLPKGELTSLSGGKKESVLRNELLKQQIEYYQIDEYFGEDLQLSITKTVSIVYDNQQNALFFLVIFEDVSERNQAIEQLEQEKIRATKAGEAKTQFLANISHEIRTPLNGAIGLTDMVLAKESDADKRHLLLMARDSADSLLHLLNDIIDYAKIENDSVNLISESFSLDAALQKLMQVFHYQALKTENHLTLDFDINIPNQVVGDEMRLRQVINNLVSNALKFTSNGEVKIKVAVQDFRDNKCEIIFEVKDTGSGIPAEKLQQIFDRFAQVDETDARLNSGAGLGLAISQYLVSRMGGKIEVDSELGVGSSFYFTVPFKYQNEVISYDFVNKLQHDRLALFIGDESLAENISSSLFSLKLGALQFDNLELLLSKLSSIQYLFVDERVTPEQLTELLQHAQRLNTNLRLIVISGCVSAELYEKAAHEMAMSGQVRTLTYPFLMSHLIKIFDSFEQDIQQQFMNNVIAYNRMLHASDSDALELIAETLSPTQSAPKRVLIAEDNEINLIVLQSQFEPYENIELVSAENGSEALKLIKEGGFDALFTDLQMPVMDGFEAARAIRQFDQEIPIIAVSAAVDETDISKSQAAGINAHLSKPINKQEFVVLLKKYQLC